MTQLNPYLSFSGNCREVMQFYQSCLGGELSLQTVGESPMAASMPHMADHIMHSTLIKEGTLLLMASDMHRGALVEGNNVTLSVQAGSEAEGQSAFSSLSAGGEVHEPFQTMFWGAMFGNCTDRYGMKWIVNYDPKMGA